jgi:hypothetical protein
MVRYCAFPSLMVAIAVAGCVFAVSARAEKVPLSEQELKDMATNIIVGKVNAVYTRESQNTQYRVTHHVAEVTVEKTEKGEGLKPGGLVYVRYWTQHWIGAGLPPPGTAGHRGMGNIGDNVRLYLVNKGYDGGGHVTDGGYNVVFANGCEVLPKADGGKGAARSKASTAKPVARGTAN